MLSLRKKTDGPVMAPAWHPNFRNYDRLPDTKVVRTAFFINGLAVLAALAALLVFAFQEFKRHTVEQQVAGWEEQIAADRAASAAAVADFRTFQAEEKKVREAAAFVERSIAPSELLLRIGQTLPEEIVLDYFDFRPAGLTLRGSVRGNPGEASGLASAYVAKLEADEVIASKFDAVVLTRLARNSETGQLNFEVNLKPRPAAEAKR